MARKRDWFVEEMEKLEEQVKEMRRERAEARERRHNGEKPPWTPPLLMLDSND